MALGDFIEQARFHLHIGGTAFKNDLVHGRLLGLIEAYVAKEVFIVQPLLVERVHVLHGLVTVDNAIKLRVDNENNRSALNVVVAQPLVD